MSPWYFQCSLRGRHFSIITCHTLSLDTLVCLCSPGNSMNWWSPVSAWAFHSSASASGHSPPYSLASTLESAVCTNCPPTHTPVLRPSDLDWLVSLAPWFSRCQRAGLPSCDSLTNQFLIINPLLCKPPFTPSQLFLVLLGQDEHHQLEGRQIPRSGSGRCLETKKNCCYIEAVSRCTCVHVKEYLLH